VCVVKLWCVVKKLRRQRKSLEALSVDDGGAGFVVFLFADPHLLEGGEGGKDGATDPNRVFTLGRSDDLNFHGRRGQGSDFLLHTVGDARVHGGAAGQDGVGVQVLTDIDVALHDRVVGGFVNTARFHTQERGLEEGFGATESFVADSDNLTVGKFVRLLEGGGAGSGGHFLLKVEGDVAKLFLDVTDNLALSGGGERVTTFGQDLHEIVSQVSAGQIQSEDGVGKGITFIDGDGVRDTIAGIEDDTGGTARGVQGKYGLNGDIHGGGVEGFEHDLGHLLSVSFGIEGSFGQENGVLFGGNTQFVVEGVMPDFLHIVPVGDNTVFDGVFQGEDTSLGLGFVSDVAILLTHADHDALMAGTSDDGGENGPRGVISGETGFAHTGAIVDNQSGNLVVTHVDLFVECKSKFGEQSGARAVRLATGV